MIKISVQFNDGFISSYIIEPVSRDQKFNDGFTSFYIIEPVSRDQIFRHVRGQGNIHFPCSAYHEQDWQPLPVDPHSAICDDHTYIHTYAYSADPMLLILPLGMLNPFNPTTKRFDTYFPPLIYWLDTINRIRKI